MSETAMDVGVEERPRRLHFEWILPAILHPRKTFETIVAQERAVWLVPLLLLSILAILSALIAMPIRQAQVQASATLPQDFQYYSPDQQQQYTQAQAATTSATMTFLFPAIGALFGVWLSWFLLASLLHLALTLAGSRGSYVSALNLAGWASLPFAVRLVVQCLAMLFSQQLITSTGFSLLVSAPVGGWATLTHDILNGVDLYLVWNVLLLMIGVIPLSGLTTTKARLITLAVVLMLLALQVAPGFAAGRLFGAALGAG
jgi:hypothetical protein